MERNSRSTFQGVVTSNKNDKTICVTVSTKRNDPLYNKRVGYSTKLYAHDPKNEANVGDVVTIMACRPISKMKRFRLVSVDKKAVGSADEAALAETKLEAAEGSAEVIAPKAEEVEAKEEK